MIYKKYFGIIFDCNYFVCFFNCVFCVVVVFDDNSVGVVLEEREVVRRECKEWCRMGM